MNDEKNKKPKDQEAVRAQQVGDPNQRRDGREDPETDASRESKEGGSHREVVFAVQRGEVDVGLATRAWAEALGLAFHPLAVEGYGLLVRATELARPEVVRLCEVAQNPRFLAKVTAIPGYDTAAVAPSTSTRAREKP